MPVEFAGAKEGNARISEVIAKNFQLASEQA
jgi:hypothetical protein